MAFLLLETRFALTTVHSTSVLASPANEVHR
jgi:hypothetical protein